MIDLIELEVRFSTPTSSFRKTILNAQIPKSFFQDQKVSLNTFLDVLMSDPCPPCLMWLPLLHRMASVEHVYHPVICDACQVSFHPSVILGISKSVASVTSALALCILKAFSSKLFKRCFRY